MADTMMIPVTLLTGFLGAGKTTLLARMIRDPRFSDTAVVINEFGEVGLDHLLVEAAPEQIVQMSSGCLCCTIRGDIRQTLLMLLARSEAGEIPLFSRLVIETTGLADPAPVIHTLVADPRLARRFQLVQIVTCVDGVNGLDTLTRHAEAYRQAAVADRLILTKTDLAAPDALETLSARLKALNPAALQLRSSSATPVDPRVLVAEDGRFDASGKIADVAAWLQAEAFSAGQGHGHGHGHDHHHDHHHGHDHGHHHGHDHEHHHDHDHDHGADAHDVNRHSEDIRAFCLVLDQPMSRLTFGIAMELLAANQGPDLLRVKGIVGLSEHPDQPVVIHAVQHILHEPQRLARWPDADRRTKLVFITRGLEPEQLRAFFAAWADGETAPNGAGTATVSA